VRAWERVDDCRDGDLFGAWLLRIVRNTAHNRREYLDVRATDQIDAGVHTRPSQSPARELDRRELRRALLSALATLRDTEREVVLLHDLDGRPHKEIAAMLEISADMSRQHLSHARKQLRKLLDDYRTLEEGYD